MGDFENFELERRSNQLLKALETSSNTSKQVHKQNRETVLNYVKVLTHFCQGLDEFCLDRLASTEISN